MVNLQDGGDPRGVVLKARGGEQIAQPGAVGLEIGVVDGEGIAPACDDIGEGLVAGGELPGDFWESYSAFANTATSALSPATVTSR